MHLRRGEYFPTFAGTAIDGSRRIVGESAHPGDRQVIFLLTSTCPYCGRTFPAWKTLAGRLDSASYPNVRVFALTTDSVQIATSFAKPHELGFPVIPFVQPKQARLAHAFTVPQTLVVNHEGLVLYSRIGVMDTHGAMDSVLAVIAAPGPAPRRSPTVSAPGGNGATARR
jgi:peroxiredoxin